MFTTKYPMDPEFNGLENIRHHFKVAKTFGRMEKRIRFLNLSHSPSACRGVTDWSKSKETASNGPSPYPLPQAGEGK